MTFGEAYASLKSMYKQFMFPGKPHARQWTLSEIDDLDIHFFHELMEFSEDSITTKPKVNKYIDDIF